MSNPIQDFQDFMTTPPTPLDEVAMLAWRIENLVRDNYRDIEDDLQLKVLAVCEQIRDTVNEIIRNQQAR